MVKIDAYKAIIVFGVISLLADTVYEGGRSITPTYLKTLGGGALIIGAIFGFSEFINFFLRVFTGIIADKTRGYWLLYIVGYVLIGTVPIIGLTNSFILISLLIVLERLAKAIRSPARDTLISMVAKDVGSGKAFGLHELMDQFGAIIGPGAIGLIMYYTINNYSLAYLILIFPYLILVLTIIYQYTWLKNRVGDIYALSSYKAPNILEIFRGFPTSFKLYIIAVSINVLGLIHWSLILYKASIILPWIAPITYLIMQSSDAVTAPIAGYLYDRYGKLIIGLSFILSTIPSILVLLSDLPGIIAAAFIFGIILGMQESIYRAAVSDIVPVEVRGTAYGIFNSLYGLGLLLSGIIYGTLIQLNQINLGIVYGILSQIIAIYMLNKVK